MHQLSLTTGGSAIDRNGSMDSLQEEHINVGLTTVPNQFCSAIEALELKKLLILSKGMFFTELMTLHSLPRPLSHGRCQKLFTQQFY